MQCDRHDVPPNSPSLTFYKSDVYADFGARAGETAMSYKRFGPARGEVITERGHFPAKWPFGRNAIVKTAIHVLRPE